MTWKSNFFTHMSLHNSWGKCRPSNDCAILTFGRARAVISIWSPIFYGGQPPWCIQNRLGRPKHFHPQLCVHIWTFASDSWSYFIMICRFTGTFSSRIFSRGGMSSSIIMLTYLSSALMQSAREVLENRGWKTKSHSCHHGPKSQMGRRNELTFSTDVLMTLVR